MLIHCYEISYLQYQTLPQKFHLQMNWKLKMNHNKLNWNYYTLKKMYCSYVYMRAWSIQECQQCDKPFLLCLLWLQSLNENNDVLLFTTLIQSFVINPFNIMWHRRVRNGFQKFLWTKKYSLKFYFRYFGN